MSDALTIMDRLRNETTEHHKAAESRPFAKAMARGDVTRDAYAGFLVQRLAVHRELENRLRKLAQADPRVQPAVDESLFQTANIEADLKFLGIEQTDPTPATESLTQWLNELSRDNPAALLGANYVLEGSKNGAAFLARPIRKVLSLSAGPGTLYLDPHGDEQRALWASYRERMGSIDFTPDEADAIVEAAKQMFDRISDCDDAVTEASSVAG